MSRIKRSRRPAYPKRQSPNHHKIPKLIERTTRKDIQPRVTYLGLTYIFIRARLCATNKSIVIVTYRLMEGINYAKGK